MFSRVSVKCLYVEARVHTPSNHPKILQGEMLIFAFYFPVHES